ncbi:MAG: arsenate reductase ArsC, partial [Betaproteobacteria bacterium]
LDFVLTVCDNAAGEVCPVWPGKPATAHWGIADPAAVVGSDAAQRSAFADAYLSLLACIRLFTSLPVETLDRLSLQERVSAIGKT